MNPTHTVVVNIGRMIGVHEMSAERWRLFKLTVMGALVDSGCTVLQHPQYGKMRAHDQVGKWEGQREPAASFTALVSGYQNIAKLRAHMLRIASLYEQEAIGFIVAAGTDHLVMT